MTSSSRPRKHKEGFSVRLCRALEPICVLRCSLFIKVIGLMSQPFTVLKIKYSSAGDRWLGYNEPGQLILLHSSFLIGKKAIQSLVKPV